LTGGVLGLSVRSWLERVGAGSTPDANSTGVICRLVSLGFRLVVGEIGEVEVVLAGEPSRMPELFVAGSIIRNQG
jgi:hypothetical protein